MSKDEQPSEGAHGEARKHDVGEPEDAVPAATEPEAAAIDTATPASDATESSGSAAADDAAELDDAGSEAAARGAASRLQLTPLFALAFAVLAAIMAGFLWWQYRQFYVSLDAADAATAAALERVRADLRQLADGLDDLDAETSADRAALAETERRLGTVPGRFAVLEQRVDAMQGGSFDARSQWLRAEAEYYLALANTELGLARRWDNAIAALELADDRLRQLADPALSAVRAEIADELIALRSVRLADIEGLVFSLAQLARRVDDLPARAAAPENYASGSAALDDAEPGLERLWQQLKAALAGIVRVERRDTPVAVVFSAEELALARRQLILELEMARLGALRGQAEVFLGSLSAARGLLERDFDTASASVEGAMTLLEELERFDVAPAPPDISGSLSLLRNAPPGGE